MLATVRTPAQGQQALNLRLEIAALAQISEVWLLSLISGVRARWYVLFITAVFLTVAVADLAIPMTGTVTGVERTSRRGVSQSRFSIVMRPAGGWESCTR